jgi:hypothetical protein
LDNALDSLSFIIAIRHWRGYFRHVGAARERLRGAQGQPLAYTRCTVLAPNHYIWRN